MPVGFAGVLLAAPLLSVIGWRGFWILNAVLLVGYAALVRLRAPLPPANATARRRISDDIREISAASGPWILAGLFAAFSASFFAVSGFLPFLLADRLAVSAEIGSVLTALAVLASAGGNLVCGQLLAQGLGLGGFCSRASACWRSAALASSKRRCQAASPMGFA